MDGFVWTKMETEFGGSLEHIVGRKEAERGHAMGICDRPIAPRSPGCEKKAPLCEGPSHCEGRSHISSLVVGLQGVCHD
jgi:hypothetical protein